MPRVHKQKKSVRGKRACGACGREIKPGEEYFWWKFRYGGKRVHCIDHPPMPGSLTQSKVGTIYDSMDSARKDFGTVEEIKAAVESIVEVTHEVIEEYREAATHFGDTGPNAEKAEELEGWVEELEQFDPEEPDETEFDEKAHQEEALERMQADEGLTLADAMQQLQDEWDEEHGDDPEEAAENARESVEDILSNFPL